MRIGILTVPFNNNYGGYLQSYALLTIVRQMGHNPVLIMRRHKKEPLPLSIHCKIAVKSIIEIIKSRRRKSIFYNPEENFYARGANMMLFLRTRLQPQTKYIYTTDKLRKACKNKFDAIIVGSDQVWRAIYVPGITGNYFMDFTNGWNIKRISYAASFGTDTPEYTEEERMVCGGLIEKFDAVSVREKSGLDVIKGFGWSVKNATTVLDPTMLLSAMDYNSLLNDIDSPASDKIFSYILDRTPEITDQISQIVNTLGVEEYSISDIQKNQTALPSIEQWLASIRDSKMVITDSYHGTVFSIIYNKPFVVCANKKRGFSRFYDLLSNLGLEDRLLTDSTNISKLIHTRIDWISVNDRLEVEKSKSLNYLRTYLDT